MSTQDEINLKVIALLMTKYHITATYEYPGYIAVGQLSFGTANGPWGWNDQEGNGGEFEIPGDSEDLEALAKAIMETTEKGRVIVAFKNVEDSLFKLMEVIENFEYSDVEQNAIPMDGYPFKVDLQDQAQLVRAYREKLEKGGFGL